MASTSRISILDGGMGTTLEDDFNADISSALWSSTLLASEEGQKTLAALHEAFLSSGAELILTCTYQSSYEGFARNGFSRSEATRLMRSAVDIAHESVRSYTNKPAKCIPSSPSAAPKVVLSLSCYGAIVGPPGQEYTGQYPAPYGPPSGSASEELYQWHLERLKIFAMDRETWHKIQGIAFETLPLLSEAQAIRRAMTTLKHDLRSSGEHHWPDWWISFVFPDGRLAEAGVEPEDIPAELLGNQDLEYPSGIGLNCTKLRFLPSLIERFELGLQRSVNQASTGATAHPQQPWLVLYPDGGLTYDPKKRKWHSESGSLSPAKEWGISLAEIARRAEQAKRQDDSTTHLWSKVVVGGCCKADPKYISELSARVHQ